MLIMAKFLHNGLPWITAIVVLTGWCIYRILRRDVTRSTVRDWLLYVVVGMLIIAAVVLSAYSRIEIETFMGWLVPICTGAIFLGYPAKEAWEFHKLTKYWFVLGFLATAHFIFFFGVCCGSGAAIQSS